MAKAQNKACHALPSVFMATGSIMNVELDECDQSHGEIILALPNQRNVNLKLTMPSQPNMNFNLFIENEIESLATYAISDGKFVARSEIPYQSLNSFEFKNKRVR